MPPSDPTDPALGLRQILGEDGVPKAPVTVPADTLLRMYRDMRRIQLLDERMLARQRQGKVGFYGPVTGQEAVPVATALAIEARDWVFPALRENAVMLTRGFPLATWIAQIYGSARDVQKGRQMPSHQSGRAVNQVSWSSCIGPQLPQAVGAAWAAKLRGDDVIAVGFLGDGATSQADFHVAMNFAGVFQTPSIIICQNNHWSISVPTSRQTASETLAIKARAYGVRGERVDGNDVIALYECIREAADRARTKHEPTFIEAVTYRIGAHSSSDDPTRYRSEEEVARWRRRDPVARLVKHLSAQGLLTEGVRKSIDDEIDAAIREAIAEVERDLPPALGTLFEDVFETMPWHLREQSEQSMNGPRASGHGQP